jgi:dihydroflavonol-4-reductase
MLTGLNGVILYPSAVIGPYDFKPSKIGFELKKIIKNRFLFSINGGYNFIDVRDVAKAIYLASKQTTQEQIILSGFHYQIKDFYDLISKMTHSKKVIIPIPIFFTKLFAIIHQHYSKMMIQSLLENDAYDDSKRKVHLFDELIPFEMTLSDTLKWLTR